MASAASYSTVVQQLYVTYFGRPADPIGLGNFEQALANANAPTDLVDLQAAYSTNSAVKSLVDSFGTSKESTTLYGTNVEAFVNAVFENVLGRAPLVAGLTFWVNSINSGAVTMGDAALSIAAAALANSTDAATIAAKTSVAQNFTTDIGTTTNGILSYNGSAAAAQARLLLANVTGTTNVTTYQTNVQSTVNTIEGIPQGTTVALTTGVDTLSAQIFNAILATTTPATTTLNAFDSLTGTATTGNVLNINSDGTALSSNGISVTNIQTVNINETANGSANIASWSGVNTLNISDIGSTAVNAAVVVGSNTAVNITGHILGVAGSSGVGNLTVDGGTNIAVTASATDSSSSASTVGAITIGGTTAPTGTVVVNATDNLSNAFGAAGNITVNGGTAVTVNSTVNYADVNGGPGSFTVGTISVAGAKGAVVVNSGLNLTANQNGSAIYHGDNVNIQGGTTVAVNLTATATAKVLASLTGTADAIANGNVQVLDGGTATSVTITEQVATAVAATAAVTASPAVVTAAGGFGYDATVTPAVAAAAAIPGTLGVSAGTVGIYGASVGTALANASNTITTVSLDNFSSATINSAVLTSLTLAGTGGATTIYNVGTTPETALTLNLNGFTDASTITETGIKTLNVVTGGTTASALSAYADTSLTTLNVSGTETLALGTVNASLTKIAVSGSAGFTGNVSGLGAALTSFTTTSSGTITAAVDDTTQTFVGSTGQDVITISADALKAITGGSAKNNEIILSGDAATFTAAHTVANVTNFTTLGVTGNTAATNEVYNLAVLTGFNSIDVISGSTGAGSDAFTNVATGTALSIDNNLSGTGTVAAVEGAKTASLLYQVANATGSSDSLSLKLGNTAGSVTVAGLMLEDANAVGLATLNVATAGTYANTITNLIDNGLATLNVTGAAGLTITTLNEQTTQATTFTINNTTTGSADQVSIGTLTDANLGSLTFTGSGASSITTLNGVTGHIVSISNTGTGTASVTSLVDASLQSLTLNGSVAFGGDTGAAGFATSPSAATGATTGVTVAAGTDNAHINLNLTGASVGNTDKITVGNGNDYITDGSTAGSVTVTVGTGSNYIDIHTGTGAGVYSVTLGTHTATTGSDFVYASEIGTFSGAAVANTTITGAVAGDVLGFASAATTAANVTTAQQTAITAAASLSAAVALAFGDSAANGALSFQYGGNTFVVEQSSTAGAAQVAGDSIVELVGLHTLTAGAVTGGHVVLAS